MPSTLAHIALQAPLTVTVLGRRALPWALLGCVIPDLGWVFQRAIKWTWRGDQEVFYDLRHYAAGQASLAACVLLCLGVAALADRAGVTFAAVVAGCVTHLLFDATQLRWGNGVHLLLPFDGRAWAPGVMGPDHQLYQIVSVAGLAALFWCRRPRATGTELRLTPGRTGIAAVCLAAFLVAPVATVGVLDRADSHSVRTLRSSDRTGMRVELYRAHYFPAAEPGGADPPSARPYVLSMASEPLRIVSGLDLEAPARVSLKATFSSHRELVVDDHHVHQGSRRSVFSIVGLLLIGWLLGSWLLAELRLSRSRADGSRS